jgi:hypothetical protein
MIKYELINKEMIVSRTARWVYRTAAGISLTIYFTLAMSLMNGPSPLLKQILFVGIAGAAIVVVGMEFFLFRFDDQAAWKQIVWFCLMLFIPLGPALYCFVVYCRSKAVRTACETTTNVALSGTKTKDWKA